jgi:hypothetical protein
MESSFHASFDIVGVLNMNRLLGRPRLEALGIQSMLGVFLGFVRDMLLTDEEIKN